MSNQASNYVSLERAAEKLGVSRSTMYYYMRQFGIEPRKFPLDRRSYIALVDLERIKAAKEAAVAQQQGINVM